MIILLKFWLLEYAFALDQIQAKRNEKVGKVWLIDETYVRVRGVWSYLYGASMRMAIW